MGWRGGRASSRPLPLTLTRALVLALSSDTNTDWLPYTLRPNRDSRSHFVSRLPVTESLPRVLNWYRYEYWLVPVPVSVLVRE